MSKLQCGFSIIKHAVFSIFFVILFKSNWVVSSETSAMPGADNKAIQGGTAGWSTFVPTSLDTTTFPLIHLEQPGSRIIYIAEDGDDDTAELYFWNGENIVDSSGSILDYNGHIYGTDPMAPSGTVKPYRRWSYVAPRKHSHEDIGTSWDGANYVAPGGLSPRSRYGFPDWWLFKRGDSFDLYEDYLSLARETNPNILEPKGGSLSIPGGKSLTERQIVGAYGSLTLPRPRFINPLGQFIFRQADPEPKHITYLSLHFDGRASDEDKRGGIRFRKQSEKAVDIVFEDMWIDAATSVVFQKTAGEFTFFRSLVTDAYRESHDQHVQGIYFHGLPNSRLQISESTLMRNGFGNGDPMTNWPPSGQQYYDIYNRNMYISGECEHMSSGVFDSVSLIGASGDQFRCGLRLERNFFYQGYIQMGAHGGYPDSNGPTGTIVDNVLQKFEGENTDDNRGHPGWGIDITSGAYSVEVARNIVTSAQHEINKRALSLGALGWYCYGHRFEYATRQNIIHDNIFDSSAGASAIRVADGVKARGMDCSNWSYPGIRNNIVSNNIFVNSNNSEWINRPHDSAKGTKNDTIFFDNKTYLNREEAALKEGWPDPNRTLKSYLQSLGYAVESTDGFIEYFLQARQQRKGYWRAEFTSKAINDYIRDGFSAQSGTWTEITYDDFEDGMGNYTKGGNDMSLSSSEELAHQGQMAARIRDNSGIASAFYHTAGHDVSDYTELEVEFWYHPWSMDNSNEDFWVQYFDGSSWQTVATFARDTDFQNNNFYNEVVTISSSEYYFPTNAKLRFICDASGNRDHIYLDEIEFRGR